ncbi:TetR family transcriptional regulator [Phytoactinopolyspora alkaliphila]|uniref:TetR family transcriptional regulator n=1 Tax=Phytoactinopolyspora alkaliphila TaxID=1783498 RepID=A0A6N9YTL9_9ACTN|nr:TetR family transcriptional regulator [Phytoactinopolyspora alkaliphila]NED98267.1 TetR family transcriptional regulator [Phytoactinopolyspora alkaliphila]
MAHNPERRTALVDAAIEVLARQGARGLTFRAVDAEAGVPKGTASNYFTSRDDLIGQVARHIHVRLGPDAQELEAAENAPRTRDALPAVLTALYQRVTRERTGYLALLELRLEATRRPEVREILTEAIRANLQRDIDYHLASGRPGDDTTVVVLYLSLSWLIVEDLTLPGVLADYPPEHMVKVLTGLLVPPD